MKIVVIACFCFCSSCHINGQSHSLNHTNKELNVDSFRCNIDIVLQLSKTIEDPDEGDILNFLYTFDETCNSNVEYREFSNEVLFQVIQKHSYQVLDLLSNKNVKTYLILQELKSPVSDTYNRKDVEIVIKKVESIIENKKKN